MVLYWCSWWKNTVNYINLFDAFWCVITLWLRYCLGHTWIQLSDTVKNWNLLLPPRMNCYCCCFSSTSCGSIESSTLGPCTKGVQGTTPRPEIQVKHRNWWAPLPLYQMKRKNKGDIILWIGEVSIYLDHLYNCQQDWACIEVATVFLNCCKNWWFYPNCCRLPEVNVAGCSQISICCALPDTSIPFEQDSIEIITLVEFGWFFYSFSEHGLVIHTMHLHLCLKPCQVVTCLCLRVECTGSGTLHSSLQNVNRPWPDIVQDKRGREEVFCSMSFQVECGVMWLLEIIKTDSQLQYSNTFFIHFKRIEIYILLKWIKKLLLHSIYESVFIISKSHTTLYLKWHTTKHLRSAMFVLNHIRSQPVNVPEWRVPHFLYTPLRNLWGLV